MKFRTSHCHRHMKLKNDLACLNYLILWLLRPFYKGARQLKDHFLGGLRELKQLYDN